MLRELFNTYYKTYFQYQDMSELTRGFIWGDDSHLSPVMKELFLSLGLSHFTAASGANLRLFLPDWLWQYPFFSWKAIVLICEALGVGAYLGLTSFSPSLWRALLFWLYGWLGLLWGRKPSFWARCFFVIFLTLWVNNGYFGSLGFQLSFLSVVALYLSQALWNREKTLRELLARQYLLDVRESIRVSLHVFLFLAPLLFWKFSELSPIGIFGTVMASPFIERITQVGLGIIFLKNLQNALEHLFIPLSLISLSPIPIFQSCCILLQNWLFFILGFCFFLLWFVNTTALASLVWVFTCISILYFGLQYKRQHFLWRGVP